MKILIFLTVLLSNLTYLINSEFLYAAITIRENQPPDEIQPAIYSTNPAVAQYQLKLETADQGLFDIRTIHTDSYKKGNGYEGKLSVLKSLDREKKARYTFEVEAQDRNGKKLEKTPIIINVGDENDNKPVILNSIGESYDVLEDTKGYSVLTLSVTDLDREKHVYGKQGIVYKQPRNLIKVGLDNSEEVIPDNKVKNYFEMTKTGVLKATGFTKIDAEKVKKFYMDLQVRDGGDKAGSSWTKHGKYQKMIEKYQKTKIFDQNSIHTSLRSISRFRNLQSHRRSCRQKR